MELDFFALAEGLDRRELERAAGEILWELEGRGASAAQPGDRDEASQSVAAAELLEAVRELRTVMQSPAPASALTKNTAAEAAAVTAPAGAALAPADEGTRGDSGAMGAALSAYREARRAGAFETASGLSAEEVSEAIRRDSRRYDAGYERY